MRSQLAGRSMAIFYTRAHKNLRSGFTRVYRRVKKMSYISRFSFVSVVLKKRIDILNERNYRDDNRRNGPISSPKRARDVFFGVRKIVEYGPKYERTRTRRRTGCRFETRPNVPGRTTRSGKVVRIPKSTIIISKRLDDTVAFGR